MESVRINISIPKNVMNALSEEAAPRKRSRFICEAIQLLIKEKRAARLASEYREAAAEVRSINREMEGTIGDGLD